MKKKLLSALLCLALALTLLPTAALAAPTRLKSVDLVIDLPKAGDPNEMETEVTIKSMKSGNIDLLANGVRNIHIYSMNKPEIAAAIMRNLSEIVKCQG